MSTRLVILGFLKERPLYGYELKQIIEKRMGDWTSIAFGSIYFALNKMSEEDLISKAATEQEGSRPSRTIYEITEAGRVEFDKLLRKLWFSEERQNYEFDIALFFMQSMPREEVIRALKQRIENLERTCVMVEQHKREEFDTNPYIPALAVEIFNHSAMHFVTELNWLHGLLKNYEDGLYD